MSLKDWRQAMDKEILEYNKYMNKLTAIKNSIAIVCFTILAIIFQKWWIVFFSALFLSHLETDKQEKENEKC